MSQPNPFASPTFGSAPGSGSSPFAQQTSAFGQTPSISSGFASTQPGSGFGQTSQLQGSQPFKPLFGQAGGPGSATQTPTQSGFGQSPGSGNVLQGTSTGFGQSGNASLFQSSAFGQSSLASTSSGANQTSLFGKVTTPNTSTSGFSSSGFGQSTSPASGFGVTNALFGGTAGSAFGKSTSVTTSATSQASFSSFSSSANTPNLFGKPTSSAVKPFSSSHASSVPNLFGKPTTVSSNVASTAVSPITQSAFSSGPVTSNQAFFGKGSPTLFGKPSDKSQSSSFGQSSAGPLPSTTATLFGKPSSSSSSQISSASSTAPTLFGKPAAVASTAFGKSSTTAGLFGKRESGQSEPKNISVFGSKDVKQSSGFFKSDPIAQGFGTKPVKTEDSIHIRKEERTGLFGKKAAIKSYEAESVGLFGKVKQEASSSPTRPRLSRAIEPGTADEENQQRFSQRGGLFHKPREGGEAPGSGVSRGLFGKAPPEEQGEKKLFGKVRPGALRRPSTSDDRDQTSTSMRRQLSEEISTKVAIVCRNLPPKYNNTNFLRTHFKKFGLVTKVFPNPTKGQATVHFKTHEAAAEAKRRGRQLSNNLPPMTIFWSSYSGPGVRRPSNESDKQVARGAKPGSEALPIARSTLSAWRKGGGEVSEELQSMSGTQDLFGVQGSSTQQLGAGTTQQTKRSISPAPVDVKGDKVHPGMFEGAVARTTTDRVQMLNLRDKYIRQWRKKDTNISTAKAFRGTCVDMCPERERYDREDKRRLSVYEMMPGTENIPGRNPLVEHSRAVKEYIRSSPDQDEPLPHELRPLPALEKTMTFLLSDVANSGQDGYWGDWFDYLWNRTRGIRKDITQQQLCDPGTVTLIEKCARFHVFCSERLCEEDMHSFDAKINNENLTKCLQTLKELYSDLEKKQNYYCPREAEFRGYMVLMNLNEGDILRQVQQLRPAVRTSPEIQFAMKAYFALNSNIYTKFFRLVRSATFGQACILHRYFTQVRNKALLTMMRGYGMGNRPAQIPLSSLVRQLAYESEEEAEEFCQYYAFEIADGEVILDKAEYLEPDTVWPARRAQNLIESKLNVSVGEMINGGSFADTEMLVPSSSFDQYDRFHSLVPLPARDSSRDPPKMASVKREPVESFQPEMVKQEPAGYENVVVKQEPVPLIEPKQEPAPPPPPPKPQFTGEMVKETAKQLFWEVIDEIAKDVSREAMSDVEFKLDFSSDFADNLLLGFMQEELQTLSQEVVDAEQEAMRRELLRERKEREQRVTEMLQEDIIEEVIQQEALNLAVIQNREVKAILRQQCVERVTVDINKDIIDEVFTDMVKDVAEEVFESDVTKRIEELEKCENIIKMSRAVRFFCKWRKEYKAVTKLKRAMQEFPCAANMDPGSQVELLVGEVDRSLENKGMFISKRARLSLESPVEVAWRSLKNDVNHALDDMFARLKHQIAWQPLDLGHVVGNILARKHRHKNTGVPGRAKSLYWKVLLCLPDAGETTHNNQPTRETTGDNQTVQELCRWLTTKMSKGKTPASQQCSKSAVISLYKTCVAGVPSVPVHRQRSLGVCVRTVTGTLDRDDQGEVEEDRLLLGTSGLVLVLPPGAPVHKPRDSFWKKERLRLQRILEVKPVCQGLPLVVIVSAPANGIACNNRMITDCLSLDDFMKTGFLSSVNAVVLRGEYRLASQTNVINKESSKKLCESLEWLAEHSKSPPSLTVGYLRDVLEMMLLEHYYNPTQHNLTKRRKLGYLDQEPNALLSLYNSVIDHIIDTLTSTDLSSVSWPVPEFMTSSQDIPAAHWNSEDHFEYLYSLLQALILPPFSPAHPTADWTETKHALQQYVAMVIGDKFDTHRVALISRLNALLKKIEEDFEDMCYLQEGESNCEPSYVNVPWSKVVSLCVDYKIKSTDFKDPVLQTSENFPELKIAYYKQLLDSFDPPTEWQHLESEKAILDTPSLDVTVHIAVSKEQEKRSIPEVKPERYIAEDPDNVSHSTAKARKTSSKLISALQAELRKSDHFQKYLESALQDGDIDNASFSVGTTALEFIPERSMNFSNASNVFNNSFDATGYFNRTKGDLSRIFDDTVTEDKSVKRRRSDIGMVRIESISDEDPHQLSGLFGKKRMARLSEIFNNDPVAMKLNEPTLTEDFESFKQSLKRERRESDMFEKRLQSLLTNSPMDI